MEGPGIFPPLSLSPRVKNWGCVPGFQRPYPLVNTRPKPQDAALSSAAPAGSIQGRLSPWGTTALGSKFRAGTGHRVAVGQTALLDQPISGQGVL